MRKVLCSMVAGAAIMAACTDAGSTAEPGSAGVPLPAASSLPETDLSQHSVPLEDIHFDTFTGGSIPLPRATPPEIAALRDRIPPIEEPVYVGPDDIDILADDDLILG